MNLMFNIIVQRGLISGQGVQAPWGIEKLLPEVYEPFLLYIPFLTKLMVPTFFYNKMKTLSYT